MKTISFWIITVCLLSSCIQNQEFRMIESSVHEDAEFVAEMKVEIMKVFEAQEKAWNNGDIPEFMKGYWNSEELTFIGSSGLTKGWQTTLDNYKKNYPDKAAMGTLGFEVKKLDIISADAAYMIGRYTLIREKDEPTGLFTLLWKKIDGEWLVVADQTCG